MRAGGDCRQYRPADIRTEGPHSLASPTSLASYASVAPSLPFTIMFDVFGVIRHLIHLDRVTIDNVIFSLHSKVTMVILVAFSLLVSKKHYFGDPIDCMVEAISSHTIDMFCWIQSTYTIPALTGGVVGEQVAHPGVSNHDAFGKSKINIGGHQYPIRYHKYYQWVVLFLFLQAGMFYFPHWIWKRLEGGRLRGLVTELDLPCLSDDRKHERMNFALQYFNHYFHHHNVYAYQFFVCELLNFVNVIGQIYLTDKFLDLGFAKYGPRVLNYSQDSSSGHDPMDEIFPKVTKCTFHKFGPSGTIMRHDALCVLPLNILNQKIFVFLWFCGLCSGSGLPPRHIHSFRPLPVATKPLSPSPNREGESYFPEVLHR
nr:innexin inx2-like isoform X2 [Cherax quadricarinatus]